MAVEARFYEKLPDKKVQCRLCPHQCVIAAGRTGRCRARVNEDGTLIAATYGALSSIGMDPIEKKPLYHFYPGTTILSIGSLGCTFHCPWCQNWQLIDFQADSRQASPEEVVQTAIRNESLGIAYTYNEPWSFYEFVFDTAALAREKGLKNVLVTNGFFMPEPLEEILPLVDAMNIDLKGITDEFYQSQIHAPIQPVKDTIVRAARDCHIELTLLLITGLNDSDDDLRAWTDFAASVSPDIPVHFSRYRPMYKCKIPPTPGESLQRAYMIAREKLNHVYLGNVVGMGGENTLCPGCGAVLIARAGYMTSIESLRDGKCVKCGRAAAVIL
jgi:pyruvate formate lyase activating enzyme